MTGFELTASVGAGGQNRPDDVRALRSRLRDLGYDWIATDDPDVDADLEAVVDLVQSIKAGRDVVRGDGRVDVPGPTYEWLRAHNAPRWLALPAGSADEGFVSAERADATDAHDYGTDWLAAAIRGAGAWYRDDHLAADPDAALLTVNDASLPRGGDTPDHAGHEAGLACDLRLPRTDGSAGGTTYRDDAYDRDAARAMLRAVRHQPGVARILFNDPELVGENRSERAPGHDDHVHFEVEPFAPVVDYDEGPDELARRAVTHFGGAVVDPDRYRTTEAGFGAFLDDVGVEHFSAREMLTPNHPDVAERFGYALFLPPARWWHRGAALALLADELRTLVDEPVAMRNWWRPRPYNAAVGGAEGSDHLTAHGVDLDYRSRESRRAAEDHLGTLYDGEPWLQLSLGVGDRTTHVGLLSPGRRRDWLYDSYRP